MKRAVTKAPNHQRILRILQSAAGPMTAYEVLDAARKHEISAPPTVYRALNKLIEQGTAHRLETINAYVACVDSQHRHGAAATAGMSRNLRKVTPCDVSGQQPANAGLRSKTRSLNSRGNVTPASDRILR